MKERLERRETLALTKKVEGEEHLEIPDTREVERRHRNENVFVRPNGLRENAKLRFRGGDLAGPARKKRYTSSREEEEEDAQMMCPCGKAIE